METVTNEIIISKCSLSMYWKVLLSFKKCAENDNNNFIPKTPNQILSVNLTVSKRYQSKMPNP